MELQIIVARSRNSVRKPAGPNLATILALLFVPLLMATTPAFASPQAQVLQPNIVVQWNTAALQGVRASKLSPPATARALAIVHTCMYDAWAAYDAKAAGTMLGSSLRRPAAERTTANKTETVSYAAYRALVDLLQPSQVTVFDPLMATLGFDPNDVSIDTTTPQGIGNVACAAVLNFRHHDGSNQLGDLAPGAYSDYTNYQPLNAPSTVPVNPATISDPNHWQPLIYTDTTGALITQVFAGPFWGRVIPFAMTSGGEFRGIEAQYPHGC